MLDQQSLAKRLLGVGSGSSDAQRIMATKIGQACLLDLIEQCMNTCNKLGQGALVLRVTDDEDFAYFSTTQQIKDNLDIAVKDNDAGMADLFRAMITQLENADPKRHAVMMRIDQSKNKDIRKVFRFDIEADLKRLEAAVTSFAA